MLNYGSENEKNAIATLPVIGTGVIFCEEGCVEIDDLFHQMEA